MGDQFPPYIYTKRGTFYFSRRIPKDIQEHFNTPRIMCSLKTKTLSKASRLAQRLTVQKLLQPAGKRHTYT